MLSRIALCALCFLFFQADSLLAKSQSANFWRLTRKNGIFLRYAHDFLDFARGGDQLSFDLETVAEETSDRVASVTTLLEIYDDLSCPQDRTAVRVVVERELSGYSKETELAIRQTNLAISSSTKPGIAAEATRMRDDLRELQGQFESIKLQ